MPGIWDEIDTAPPAAPKSVWDDLDTGAAVEPLGGPETPSLVPAMATATPPRVPAPALPGVPLAQRFTTDEGPQSWGEAMRMAQEPFVPIPKLPSVEEVPPTGVERALRYTSPVGVLGPKVYAQLARSAVNSLAGLGEFVESPLGVASAASGMIAPTLTSAAFTADLGRSLYHQGKQLWEDWDQLTAPQRADRVAQAVGTLTMAAGTGKATVAGVAPRIAALRGRRTALPPVTPAATEPAREPEVAPLAPTPETESGAAGAATTPAEPAPTAEAVAAAPAGPPIRPTTTGGVQSQAAEAAPAATTEVPSAIPIEAPDALHVRPAPGDRGAVGEGVRTPAEELARKEAEEKAAQVTPAIQTPSGRVVTGEDHVAAYEKAKATGTPDTSGSREGFVDAGGKFISREQAAVQTELPTETEAGKLHSSDLPAGPGAETAGERRYHPITQLADQLRASKQTSVPEGISAKEQLADTWAKGKSMTERAVARMRAVSESIKQSVLTVPKITDVTRSVEELDSALQRSIGRSMQAKEAMKAERPNLTVRDAAAIFRDSGGRVEDIRAALGQLPKETTSRVRRAMELAANPTDAVREFSDFLESYYGIREQDAIQAGVFEHGIKDYFTHIWRREDNMPGSLRRAMSNGQVNTYFQFGRQRKIGTLLEGILQGKTPELDPADVLPFYNHSLDRAIASRSFIKQLSELEAEDGRPVVNPEGTRQVVPRGGEPEAMLIRPRARGKIRVGPETPEEEVERLSSMEGYEVVNHPALRKWKWAATDEKGNPIFYQADLRVHPDYYQRISRMMDRGRLTAGPIARGALAVSGEVKGSMFGLPSAFHPMHVGLHGAFHWTNPFKDIHSAPIDWDSPKVAFAIEKGHLKVAPDPAELAQFAEGMSGRGLLSRLPYVREWSNVFTQWLFQDYIPKLKLRTFDNAYARAIWMRDKLGAYKGLSEDQIAARTGDSVNNAYGELNRWFLGKHGRDPGVQRLLQGMFLAPDFGEARLRFVGKAFTRYGHEERIALATMFLTLYTAARVGNIISHGDPEFDDWRRHAFSVKVGDRWYSVRSVLGDVDHAIANFGQFIYVRLNPVYTRTIFDMIFSRDIYGRKISNLDKVLNLAKTVVPIQFGGLVRADRHVWESFLSSMGLTPTLETPVQDIGRLVGEWERKSKDPRIQAQVKAREQSVYPPSQYQALRRALYDNDAKKAKAEIDKLLKTRTFLQIAQAMSPYTLGDAPLPKAFTHSQVLEPQFLAQLTEPQRKVYDAAIAQRQKEFSRMLDLYK